MSRLPRPTRLNSARLHASTSRRVLRRYGIRPGRALARLDERLVFVVGSPRSGTSFTATAIGDVPGFVDLGEVNRLKAAVPAMYRAVRDRAGDEVVEELRRLLRHSQRFALAAGARAIEQTPESSYLIPQLAAAFPEARFVHLVRDGRDVAASLIERGWLAGDAGSRDVVARGAANRRDDAGQPFGGYARFWVEAGRESEFERAPEARRCAWAWRRYESAAREGLAHLSPDRVVEVRYEDLASDPAAAAVRIATALQAQPRVEAFAGAFAAMHARSVGRFRTALDEDQLAQVEAEAGSLLTALGYH